MKSSILLCTVLLCGSALAAPLQALPPYRVVLIDDVNVNIGMLGGLSQFPYGERRFQMAGTLPDLVVVGTAAFQRNDGTNNEWLARGRTWTWNSGSWTEAPIISEGSGNPRIATLAMDINADGVIAGAIAAPNISSVWNRNASVWRPVSSSLVQSDLAAPSGSCQPTDSVALGVGPGEDPAVAGFVATRCQYGLYEPFTGWLDADPNYGG